MQKYLKLCKNNFKNIWKSEMNVVSLWANKLNYGKKIGNREIT
jgi:hypothetical protein